MNHPGTRESPNRSARRNRVKAALWLCGCAGLLTMAAFLTPQHGLHETLGWPRCGFRLVSGLPCATCGMTTAFTHAADGNLLAAARVQPAGALLALATAMMTVTSAWALWTGASLAPVGRVVWRPRIIVTAIVVLTVSWFYTAAYTMHTGACPT